MSAVLDHESCFAHEHHQDNMDDLERNDTLAGDTMRCSQPAHGYEHVFDRSGSSNTLISEETVAGSSPPYPIDGFPFRKASSGADRSIEGDTIRNHLDDGGDHEFPDPGHHERCTGSPGASTPPDSPQRYMTPPTHAPSTVHVEEVSEEGSPRLVKKQKVTPPSSTACATPASSLSHGKEKIKISKTIQEDQSLHQKAVLSKSDGTLPPNRYWIGVLHPDVELNHVKKDKNLVWIKGNGGSTVKTIWHVYQSQAGLLDNFHLTCHGEMPRMTDVMRELDHYNDRFVIFRAVIAVEID